MSRNSFARGFEDLEVYRRALGLAQAIQEVTKQFPRDERYSLTDQVRRSARSIGAQIAEAWAKRNYPRHFASKLSDADGEQNETRHWITMAESCHYLHANEAARLHADCHEIGRMLQSMINKAEQFCVKSSLSMHDASEPYSTDIDDWQQLESPSPPSTSVSAH